MKNEETIQALTDTLADFGYTTPETTRAVLSVLLTKVKLEAQQADLANIIKAQTEEVGKHQRAREDKQREILATSANLSKLVAETIVAEPAAPEESAEPVSLDAVSLKTPKHD